MNFATPEKIDACINPNLIRTSGRGGLTSVDPDFHLLVLLAQALNIPCSFEVADMYSSRINKNCSFFISRMFLDESSLAHSTYPFEYDDYTFVIRKPEYVTGRWAFTRVFSLATWLGVLLSTLLVIGLHFFTFRGKVNLQSAIFYIWGSMFGNCHDWRPRSLAEKLAVLWSSLGLMIIAFSFGSVLLTHLTIPVREKGIMDFEDLYHAVKEGKTVATLLERASNIMTLSENEKNRFVGEHMSQQKSLSIYDRLKQNLALIAMRRSLRISYSADNYFISGDTCYPMWFVVGYNTNSRLKANGEPELSGASFRERYGEMIDRGIHRI